MMPQLPEYWMEIALRVAILVAAAWIADWIASRFLHRVLARVAARTRSNWDDRIVERKVIQRLAHVVPALVIFLGIGLALGRLRGGGGRPRGASPRSPGHAAWRPPGSPSPW